MEKRGSKMNLFGGPIASGGVVWVPGSAYRSLRAVQLMLAVAPFL